MEQSLGSRLKHAWNAFRNRDPTQNYGDVGTTYYRRPDRIHLTRGNERSIVTSVFNRIALDVSAIGIKHCRIDENGRYLYDIKSGLNNCLNLSANTDQTGRAFMQDVVMSMLDEGCVGLLPIETDLNPKITQSYDILSMRTCKIIEWRPAHVKVRVYNEETGKREVVGLVDNPEECECRLEHIEDYFKGKFTEIKDAINLMPNNKVKVLFGVRTTDDNKQYQDVYTKMFLSNATSNYDKISKDLQDRKDNGSYPNTEFVVADLQEYEIKATNFNNSNNGGNDGEMPFDAEAPASTDWFSGN